MDIQDKNGAMGPNPIRVPINHLRVDVGKSSTNGPQMKELYASSDEHTPKARKPYTITKQRERWTEEEHKKFVEALKLYGRAWRRIEEHISTKTAVQIRSHAQKFFSKVVKESNCSSNSMNSIEIPPPRPKRKPMHPYPRKVVPSSAKSASVPEQQGSLLSPILSPYEQENRSPSSVLTEAGSETPPDSCTSPTSSAVGSNPTGLLLKKQEAGCPTSPSSANKENTTPPPVMKLDMGLKNHACIKETSPIETPTSLKLFGRTVLVSTSQQSSSPVDEGIQFHKSFPSIESASLQEESGINVRKISQQPPEEMEEKDMFMISKCSIDTWPCKVTPLVYCMQIQKKGSSSVEATSPVPWLASQGNVVFPFAYPHNGNSRSSPSGFCMEASENKETSKEVSRTVSNTSSINDATSAEKNKNIAASQHREKEGPVMVFQLKVSENSAFSILKRSASDNRPKGFVPYKRCMTEGDVQQTQIGGKEREGHRIRLCL